MHVQVRIQIFVLLITHRLKSLCTIERESPNIYSLAPGCLSASTFTKEPTSSTSPLSCASLPTNTSPEKVLASSLIFFPLCLFISPTKFSCALSQIFFRYSCAAGSVYAKGESTSCRRLLDYYHSTCSKRSACGPPHTVTAALSILVYGTLLRYFPLSWSGLLPHDLLH